MRFFNAFFRLNQVMAICCRIVLLEKRRIINGPRDKSAMMAELDAYFTGFKSQKV